MIHDPANFTRTMTVRDSSRHSEISANTKFLTYCCVSIYDDISINILTEVNFIIPHFIGSWNIRIENTEEISHK